MGVVSVPISGAIFHADTLYSVVPCQSLIRLLSALESMEGEIHNIYCSIQRTHTLKITEDLNYCERMHKLKLYTPSRNDANVILYIFGR